MVADCPRYDEVRRRSVPIDGRLRARTVCDLAQIVIGIGRDDRQHSSSGLHGSRPAGGVLNGQRAGVQI
ncbi:hypothetical protein Ciccas_014461 [Cichlidogyrus casuarinus]|uniref:Uncharacterized protein n=1 Tax=Cichlidogyrus casuarinus TaxID=1844966 RepID=A0ABD2PJF1_9PLAT